MKNSLFKLTFLFLIITSFQSKAAEQRVFGFLGDWHSNYYYTTSGVQYDYMTDIVFAFILPEADGSFAFDINSSTWYSRLSEVVKHGHAKGVKVHVSAGGWGVSKGESGVGDPIHDMCNNKTSRDLFIANILNLIKTYKLDGFNMDWEYPATADASVLTNLLIDLKIGMIALEEEMNKTLELSIAVAAGTYGTGAYNMNNVSIVDLVMIMAFDNQATNHSTVSFAKSAMNYWKNQKGITDEQLILAIPFYSKGTNANTGSYKKFSNSDPAGFYNDDNGSKNGYQYNSKPVLVAKLAEVKSRGGSGVFIWEITQDRTDEYSLLRVLYGNLVSSQNTPNTLTKVSVFPNPVSDVLNFNLTGRELLYQDLVFNISDITGKIIQQGKLNQLNNTVNIESIGNGGIYFVTVKNSNNETATFKLIKK